MAAVHPFFRLRQARYTLWSWTAAKDVPEHPTDFDIFGVLSVVTSPFRWVMGIAVGGVAFVVRGTVAVVGWMSDHPWLSFFIGLGISLCFQAALYQAGARAVENEITRRLTEAFALPEALGRTVGRNVAAQFSRQAIARRAIAGILPEYGFFRTAVSSARLAWSAYLAW